MLLLSTPVVCRFLDRISPVFFFFSHSLFSLHSTGARLPHTVSICECEADWKEGPPTSSLILMADEIASCCACLERSVTYVTRLCMPIFPRRTVVWNGYCKETKYNWEHVYILGQLIIQATHVGVSPKNVNSTRRRTSSVPPLLFFSSLSSCSFYCRQCLCL